MTNAAFQPGALLVYPPTGLVRLIEDTTGPDGKPYHRLSPVAARIPSVLFVAAEKAAANGLRSLSTKAEYREACAILRQCKRYIGGIVSDSYYGLEAWEARIASGPMAAQARILRDFWRDPSYKTPLSPAEKIIFDKALHRLTQEMAAILNWPVRMAEDRVFCLLTLPRKDLSPAEEALELTPTSRSASAPQRSEPPHGYEDTSRRRHKKRPAKLLGRFY